MNKRQSKLLQFESQLEGFIEGMFGKQVGVEALMRAVANAFEDSIAEQIGQHTVTPDMVIQLHPVDYGNLLASYPYFDRQLIAYIVELARERGLLLPTEPRVNLAKSDDQSRGSIAIYVSAAAAKFNSTAQMEPISVAEEEAPQDAQLIRDGRVLMTLERHVINIGRRFDNHLVLDDHRISRQHCQLRLRNRRYVIYDLDSTHGVFVNGERVSEYILQNGDVISLGGVQLLYIEDDSTGRSDAGDTQINPPWHD